MDETKKIKTNFDDCVDQELKLNSIGVLRSSRISKFETPHQADNLNNDWSVIELKQSALFSHSLCDLESFSHIWLIWWFHRNQRHWKPKVLPPRGNPQRRGVFATRSPHRPNPIGMTAVKLIRIEKNRIYIASNDLLDGTPILDIKPYLPYVDCIPEANSGWVAAVDAELAMPAVYKVIFSDLAEKKINWLKNYAVNFIDRAKEILERDPKPHKTRRIKQMPDNKFRISCAGWRMIFSVSENIVLIEDVFSGYPKDSLISSRADYILDYKAHFDFYQMLDSF